MPRPSRRSSSAFDPRLSHGVLAIVLLVLAIIITLGFFDKAGTVGVIINDWILSFILGLTRYTLPIVLVVLAWYLVADLKYDYRPTHGIGTILFVLSLSSLLHIGFEPREMWLMALEGNGGGVFGMLAWPMKTYFGTIAAWIVLIGTMLISVILLFNTSLVRFVQMNKELMGRMGGAGTGLRKTVDTLFVPHAEDEEDAEEEDDEEIWEEDEVEEEEPKRRFIQKRLGADESDEEDEEYEDENEEEGEEEDEENAGASTTHQVPLEPVLPMWQQNVIIRKPPTPDLLQQHKGKPSSGDIDLNKKIIQDTLAEFNIEVEMDEIRVGPTVTQFSLRPAKGVKISRITALSNDLALALAAHPVRIEAPIPGKSLVGIEVPNAKAAKVSLRELIESPEYEKREHNMMIGLGKDVGGKVWFANLPRMPHLLIAGATGSGKTVCMNTAICSLLYQNTAETLRMIMVDPKRVELTLYNGIPHLLTPVITNTTETVNALKWTTGEMDRRFELLSQAGNRDITSYNAAHPDTKMPHIVFIVDELADLMATASGDIEAGIIRIAQMARAVGIHLIVATQRPSVDVITGLMKANIPGRIAFSVASITDSRTILDSAGADKLIGKGDMLLQTAELSKPVRIQGAFISEDEVKRIVKYLRGNDKPVYDESIVSKQSGGTTNMFGGPNDDQDPLFNEAKNAIIEAGKASASFLQRRLKVGYARAARLLDELEEAGVIGPGSGAKPREILVTEREVETSSMDLGGELNVFKSSSSAEMADTAGEEEDEEEIEEDDSKDEDPPERNNDVVIREISP